MLIYHYNKETGEYLGESTAVLDPLEGLPLIPASATSIKPPASEPNSVARFVGGIWESTPDYRGYKGFDAEGEVHEINTLGVEPDSSWALTPPPPTEAELATQYQRDRAAAYPTLAEQADMAYWDRQNGTTTLDDAITAVKTKYPKS